VLEAMKMENALPSPANGTVKAVNFAAATGEEGRRAGDCGVEESLGPLGSLRSFCTFRTFVGPDRFAFQTLQTRLNVGNG
jgi:hypothetical protein